MTKVEYREYEERVAYYLDGLKFISTGYCPGCAECTETYGETDDDGHYPEVEGSFSWESCEICNRPLGGDRFPWHAVNDDDEIIHGECCVDCMYYLEYGQLDDMTMLDMEEA